MCAPTYAMGVDSSNSERPVISSKATTPRLYTSLWPVTSSPAACSGLMYCGVPTDVPCMVSFVLFDATSGVIAALMPKSSTTTRPLSRSIIMLLGLMSL